MSFPDYFSAVAAKYAAFRPRYPAALVALLVDGIAHDAAWDVGCGSGQLSTALADHFAHVIATDPSADQLAQAVAHPRVAYRRAAAEASGLAAASADLVVAAQAAHWFDWPAFVAEAGRVIRPGGRVATVAYGDCTIAGTPLPAFDHYKAVVEHAWPAQRVHIDNGYRDLVLPWPAEPTPKMEIAVEWTRDELAGYLSSWSATNRHAQAHGLSAFEQFTSELRAQWPDGERRHITWPLVIKRARR